MDKRDLIAFAIHYGAWEEDMERYGSSPELVEGHLMRWRSFYVPSLTAPHHGDCVNVPITCMRCLTEAWYKMADNIIAATQEGVDDS